MKKYYISKTIHNTHRFEIVEKIPSGYQVWCIGDNMQNPEMLPLTRIKAGTKYDIDPDTLKTVKMEASEVKILHFVAMRYGLHDLEHVENYLKRKKCKEEVKAIAEKAAAIFRKYM